uniref:Uncharacterized protein n=1 Tax=Pyramimonas obovata TaxID=1411642 RepID=A0A7S0WEG9_9CHLO|mmetsp:Transcript_23740/g.51857  ORF Transcript_23740/g.51857 Transcript_23740/m.51857 type:complete len:377 (+) Transcript_23740:180-1310(+)|eukprot:CAMPEP_0118920796 /NCGR_PEP_ID=MMETSP1169-20130426/227_1 /TAXON_ID=36882 /ORGANISM="Pyramimonas obovata, Strain CCMP722" /LENGTH=376 /DNA_ID=CAMNT_0006861387 /DNA_START=157 /DNA_END=1287 /DNA_ORIENTATION=+
MSSALQTHALIAPVCVRRTVTQRFGRAVATRDTAKGAAYNGLKASSRGVSLGMGRSSARGPLRIRATTEGGKSGKETKGEVEIVEPETSIAPKEDRSEAATELALVVAGAVAFGLGLGAVNGLDDSSAYFAAYILEQSLSIDNLFVFVLIFNYFNTTPKAQKRALKYGLVGSAVMRAIAVFAGAAAVNNFRPILLVFAGILMFSSYKLLFGGEDEEDEDLADSPVFQLCNKYLNVSDNYDGEKFFTMVDGARKATPLLLVVAVIELSDVVFAVDSIPAVFGITTDPLIVYSSNVFAILALRSMFSFVAELLADLEYLETSLGGVLAFIGGKIIADVAGYEVPTPASLLIVTSMLGVGITASLTKKKLDERASQDEL